MGGVVAFEQGSAFISKFNNIQLCTKGLYGVYNLDQLDSISDYGSTYQNNSASTGGVYYILAKTTDSVDIDIRYCIFKENLADIGGVFALFNYFDLFLYGSTLESNFADQGGVFSISMISTLSGTS